MTKLATTLLAVVALVALAVPTAASAKHHKKRCDPKRSDIVTRSKQIAVYGRDANMTIYACLRPNGRSYSLGEVDDIYSSVGAISLAAPYVSWAFDAVPACKADCPPGTDPVNEVHLLNLRTGKDLTFQGPGLETFASKRGAVAWVTGGAGSATIHIGDASGERVADTGNIDASTIVYDGTTLSWTKDGAPQSTPL